MTTFDLSRFDLFNGVPSELINQIMSEQSICTIPAGQFLVKKDLKNNTLYLLLKGEVEIYLEEYGEPLKKVGPGNIIGEISVIDQKSATASAIALCDCRVIVFGEKLLWEFIKQSHVFAINFILLITNRFRSVNSQVVSSLIRQRLSEQKAVIDSLTRLYNRGWLNENFPGLLERCKKDHRPFSYLMIDVDHFKQINDNYGHQTGDLVLQRTAELLTHLSRANDFAVRYGGEEMALLLPNTDSENGLVIAERIRKLIEQNNIEYTSGKTLSISVSIGVSSLMDSETCTDLIRLADEALYYAKSHGRNQIKFNDGKLSSLP